MYTYVYIREAEMRDDDDDDDDDDGVSYMLFSTFRLCVVLSPFTIQGEKK